MDVVELSDLEEGEILEYDSHSPVDSNEIFEIKKYPPGLKKDNPNCHFEIKNSQRRNLCLAQQRKHGYVNKNLREGSKLNGKLVGSPLKPIELESISSDGEYVSDNDEKYMAQQKDHTCNGMEMRRKGKHSAHFYGTVEDIMSEIGETICRKSRNYKKRKSRDFVKYSDNSYNLWRDRVFSSHIKEKQRKRNVTESDSECEIGKGWVEKRKKRKKKRDIYYEDGVTKKNEKVRDFDEMRRNLLEKLKKQKAEEALKALMKRSSPPEDDNSKIQEVDMLIDCTNYVDQPLDVVKENSVDGVEETQEKEGEEELDLVQLRLIALASNKKGKNGENQCKTETPESVQEDKKSEESNTKEEVDLDRNELLLRAEALKTALLKKHKKILNKVKTGKSKTVGSSSDNDLNISLPNQEEKDAEETKAEEMASTKEKSTENFKESTSEPERTLLGVPCDEPVNQKVLESNVSPRKGIVRVRNKRKKRKSCSLANSLKENSDKSEVVEEDDHTLRSQLLNDLMKKKSLKDSEKKPVLMDSIQTSPNQIPVVKHESRKENEKQPPVKKNSLKKAILAKASKSVAVPKVPVPEIQRIIVHLGSEDSSDENGPQEEKASRTEGEVKGEESAKVECAMSTEKIEENVQASYEKSVELLLSQARKKIEGKLQSAKNNALGTPEAVYKHLPPSQRLEYLRLKQKIAERERLRKQKNEKASSGSKLVETSPPGAIDNQKLETQSKPKNLLPVVSSTVGNAGLVKTGLPNPKPSTVIKNVNGTVVRTTAPRLVSNKLKNNLVGMHGKASKGKSVVAPGVGTKPSQPSNSLLLPSSQAMITKLKLLLKKIKIEKTIEENYEKEISKLKIQLNLFERRKTEQRFKIKKLGEESMKTYRAIQGITAKSKEKVLVKEENGVKTEEKKAEEDKGKQFQEGKSVPEKETKAESENVKELKSDGCVGGDAGVDERRTNETVSGEPLPVVGLLKYSSPLEAFKKASNGSGEVDPNVMMCQFDLMGVCKDEECTYQHLRKS